MRKPDRHTVTGLIDMDDVVAGFSQHLFDTCLNVFGENVFAHDSIANQPIRFGDTNLRTEHKHLHPQVRALFDAPGWFESLPVIDGAVDGFFELSEHADLWFCTKPLTTSSTSRDEKVTWVGDHFGPEWADRVIPVSDKSMVVGDFLLDDAIYPAEAAQATWKPVVYPAGFNFPGSEHGKDWQRWQWGDDPFLLCNPASDRRR